MEPAPVSGLLISARLIRRRKSSESTFPPSSRPGPHSFHSLVTSLRVSSFTDTLLPGYIPTSFEVDDLEKDWTWPENYFDFVHARHLEDGIKDHERLIKQMFKHVRPGGYAEISEIEHKIRSDDGTYEGSGIQKWTDLFLDSCAKAGQVFPDGEYTKKVMEKAGFVDVKVHTFVLPYVSNLWVEISTKPQILRLGWGPRAVT